MLTRLLTLILICASCTWPLPAADRPNILWLTSEDNGPHLGCYGDKDATTPNLDKLAARGLRYRTCWSVAPVCAPARTAIITGMYPSSTGAEHMRSLVKLPKDIQLFPYYLRQAGYYCTNNSKEDYNVEPNGKAWDESSGKAHWKNRGKNQPFFAVFNSTVTHESAVRKRPHKFLHDPSKVFVPPYHPDNGATRQAWAQYHDQMSEMDGAVGKLLQELTAAELDQDTIIFYYGDHGPGLARNKRYPGQSGLRVPLIVHFPPKWKHLAPVDYKEGGESLRLVSFVDLAPTLLSICGIDLPTHLQGNAFAGGAATPAPSYNYGLRGRMDEREDLARSITDGRYVYIRNYAPHKPWGQHVSYMFETPLTQEWFAEFKAGKATGVLAEFWQPKGAEQFFDLEKDPYELKNLASDPAAAVEMERFRKAHEEHASRIRDVALLPEAEMWARSDSASPRELGLDQNRYDFPAVFAQAQLATNGKPSGQLALLQGLQSADSAVRYWSALGLMLRGPEAVQAAESALKKCLLDACGSVQVQAAEALARHGNGTVKKEAEAVLHQKANCRENPYFVSVAALNVLSNLPNHGGITVDQLKALPIKSKSAPRRSGEYVERLVQKLVEDTGSKNDK